MRVIDFFKDTAGIFLASDEDFKVGYTVTAAGVTGVIKSIDLRKSRIVAEDGKLPAQQGRRDSHLGGGGARRG